MKKLKTAIREYINNNLTPPEDNPFINLLLDNPNLVEILINIREHPNFDIKNLNLPLYYPDTVNNLELVDMLTSILEDKYLHYRNTSLYTLREVFRFYQKYLDMKYVIKLLYLVFQDFNHFVEVCKITYRLDDNLELLP
jgi:hypothetical protein